MASNKYGQYTTSRIIGFTPYQAFELHHAALMLDVSQSHIVRMLIEKGIGEIKRGRHGM